MAKSLAVVGGARSETIREFFRIVRDCSKDCTNQGCTARSFLCAAARRSALSALSVGSKMLLLGPNPWACCRVSCRFTSFQWCPRR
eukprot:scaffold1070_cov245-Pinguiococcus_pyrenoidosus.AAC.31